MPYIGQASGLGFTFGTKFTALARQAAAVIQKAQGVPGAAERLEEIRTANRTASTRLTPERRSSLYQGVIAQAQAEQAARIAARAEQEYQEAKRLAQERQADIEAAAQAQQASLIPGMSNKTLITVALAIGGVWIISDLLKPRKAKK